jgi:hypothetical protein
MKEGTVFLYKGGKDIISKAIKAVTGSEYAHTAIYLGGMTFDSTVWQAPRKNGKSLKWWMIWKYRSGMRETMGVLESPDLRLVPKTPLEQFNVWEGQAQALMMVNSRAWYNVFLLVFDAILYPTRKLWAWVYRKTGWAPFMGPSTNCSAAVDEIYKAMGIDLWPGEPESLTVPGDYPKCDLLEVEV